MSKLELEDLINIEEVYYCFLFHGLLDYIEEERHMYVSGQMCLLNIFCLKHNIKSESELYGILLHSTLRICKIYEGCIDFKTLIEYYEKTKKEYKLPIDKYSFIFYETEMVSGVCDLYSKNKNENRIVLIEKKWIYHIGCKNYWNKKTLKYEQTIN